MPVSATMRRMLNRRASLAWTFALLCAAAAGVQAAADDPYTVELWADALFGNDGRISRLEVPDASEYPPAFVERVRKQLATAKIPIVNDASGAPATFQTGVRLSYRVTPATAGLPGTVKLTGMQIGPRPLKRYAASPPDDLPPNTPAEVKVRCQVGIDGVCGEVKIVEMPGTSDRLRRWAVATMRGWRFEPQRVNGQPVPGEHEVRFVLSVQDNAPTDFRDPRRL